MVDTYTDDLPKYTYCRIDKFRRYYFIDDIVLTNEKVCEIYMHCDVLASFRYAITESTQYVARSSSNFDGRIVDNLYATVYPIESAKTNVIEYPGIKSGGTYYPNQVVCVDSDNTVHWVDYFNQNVSDGNFVVGIVGNNATGTSFYSFDYSHFKSFIQKVFALNPSDMSDVSSGLANAIYDPMSYITFCRWYPDVTVPTSASSQTIYVGRYQVTETCAALNEENVSQYYASIQLPVHPNISSRSYLNLSPFTEITLYFEPFGNIPIDTTKVPQSQYLYLEWDVDYCSGVANLKINDSDRTSVDPKSLIYYTSSDYGVTIPISGLNYDAKGGLIMAGLSLLKNSAVSVMGSRSTGRSKPAYMPQDFYDTYYGNSEQLAAHDAKNVSMIDTIMDAAGSALGQLQTSGASGSFLSYNSGPPKIFNWYMDQVEYDDARFGRPLYQKKKLSSLSGFCACLNASITDFKLNTDAYPAPTSSEYSAIVDYLNSGVYLE